ncbi:nucleotidyltransferase family protein [Streptomyces carpinensis]|uniref:Nucleotidyltransferase family protein n=1 Tax=Streptomyces carpinensis TaxID=66369 RepID=A0ABV1WBW1_9ACTN|nr:nucleotidyltransferase family protein [Streptomyces carpinensis]
MTRNGGDAAPARRAGPPDLRLAAGEAELPAHRGAQSQGQHLPRDRNQAILEAAKQIGALLKRKGHAFALAGSVAAYAHGGSGNLQHDADFCVRREDAEAVADTLREGGLPVYTPPEDWLIKSKCFDQDVDIIFELAHEPVSLEMLARAEELPVDSVRMPVLAPTDLLCGLVAAFSEHHCDFGAVLPIARALREKVDWERVRRACGDEPMPAAFFFLLERLNVITPQRDAQKERRDPQKEQP